MIKEKIDNLIAIALKHQDEVRLSVLRLIKNEIVKKEKDGIEITDVVEANVLMKMMSQRDDSIEQFKKAHRMDLVEKELKELEIIKEFAPKTASEADIEKKTTEVINEISKHRKLSMKDMKEIMTIVQMTYPTANGKTISKVLKSFI